MRFPRAASAAAELHRGKAGRPHDYSIGCK